MKKRKPQGKKHGIAGFPTIVTILGKGAKTFGVPAFCLAVHDEKPLYRGCPCGPPGEPGEPGCPEFCLVVEDEKPLDNIVLVGDVFPNMLAAFADEFIEKIEVRNLWGDEEPRVEIDITTTYDRTRPLSASMPTFTLGVWHEREIA